MLLILSFITCLFIYYMMQEKKREKFKHSLIKHDLPTWAEYCRLKNAITADEKSEAWDNYKQLKEVYGTV